MEVKVFERYIKSFGLDEYTNLHVNIIGSSGDNLLNIKRFYDKIYSDYNLINSAQKNIFFQGYTIEQGFVYFITNTKTGRKYIGQTKNLVSRMESYIRLQTDNAELKHDLIRQGLASFTVEFLKTEDHIEEEKRWITHHKDNCYNKLHAGKNFYVKSKIYSISGFEFKSKKKITEYVRELLDSYVPGYILDDVNDSKEINFAKELIKLHPKYDNYNRFLETGSDISLKIIKDNQGDAWGTGKWNIFSFSWTDNKNKRQEWSFSTGKIIDSL
jgi:hypothetical protein